MRRVIFTQKGGVGKTTIVCNLAAISAARGLRTLVVDLDPQANATQYLGLDPIKAEPNLLSYFQRTLQLGIFRIEASACIHETSIDNLHLLPSHPELESLQHRLESRYKIYKLREALKGLEDQGYEAIYIDTPPALNFYTRSALYAADRCLIPFDCDAFSRKALYGLLDAVEEVREDHNPALVVEGIVVNQYQGRARLPQRLVGDLVDEGLPVLEPALSPSVKVRESHDARLPLIQFAPSHKVTRQFVQLHDVLERDPAIAPATATGASCLEGRSLG